MLNSVSSSRTSKVIKNSFVSVVTQIIVLFLGFINRKIFVTYMDIEYLGYQNLFTNIFSLLNVTELGIGGIITFHLYRELAIQNISEITKLMKLYKYVYRLIAFVVLVLGIAIYFILPSIIIDNSFDWHYIHIIYSIQLFGTVVGYFLSYMRTMFVTDQMEYKTLEIDLGARFLTQIFQVIVIIVWKNFVAYMFIGVFTTILANIVIAISTLRHYPYLKSNKIKFSKEDVKRWNIISDIKNFLVHKISYSIYGGTDNLVISAICGIKNVALYGNYYMLQSQLNSLVLYRLLNPIQATVGNYVYSESDIIKQQNTFRMLDTFCHWIASFAMASYLLFYQPFIKFWLGEQYLLPYSFVFAFTLTSYLGISCEMLYKYRCTFGDYDKDRNAMIASAIINVVVSIGLAKFIGMLGVQIGTILAWFPIGYGRMKLVVGGMLKMSNKQYVWEHFKLLVLELVQSAIMLLGAMYVGKGLWNIVFRIFLFLVVPTLMNWLYFRKRQDFKDMMIYINKVLSMAKSKVVRKA